VTGSGTAVVHQQPKAIYWHRELPSADVEAIGEHTLDANSHRVPDTIAHRDELWTACNDDLMARASERLLEEIPRLGGRYAHVGNESIATKHDTATGEAWFHGRFSYVLYR
jgi:hypothetical protein